VIQTFDTRSSADIQQDTDVGLKTYFSSAHSGNSNKNAYLKKSAECIEEPAMAVDLFSVFLLETEYYLGWHNSFVGIFEPEIWVQSECRSVLENVCSYISVLNSAFHYT